MALRQTAESATRAHLVVLSRWLAKTTGTPVAPLDGEIVARFGANHNGKRSQGVLVTLPAGRAVAAPASGEVVFAGALPSIGRLLIIDHGDGYHSVLSGFSRLSVSAGAKVTVGDKVGLTAMEADRQAELLVELRRRGIAVDPLPWLLERAAKDEHS